MEDNKYMIDYTKVDTDEKRELRRKRRVRSRILAWVFLLIFVVLILVGGFFLLTKVFHVTFKNNNSNTETSVSTETEASIDDEDINDVIDDLLGKEDEVVVTEPEPVGPTEEELFEEALVEYIATMSLTDKVAGLFIVSPEQITGVATVVKAGDGTKAALTEYAVGGLIYEGKNILSEEQFKTMITNTVSYAKYPLFLAVDEELGGKVLGSTLKLEGTKNAAEVGESMDPQLAFDEETKIATYLSEYGLNLNFGIVCDIASEDGSGFMDNRTFGNNTSVVNAMVSRTVEALAEKKIIAALKYFPSLASGNQDTGVGIASSEKTKEEMTENEFKVFLSGVDAGAKMVVISHTAMPNLTGNSNQSSLSKEVMTDLLRAEFGLDDLIIITDAMDKPAISEYYDSADSAVTAIKSGADMILNPASFKEAYSAVLDALQSGVISEARVNDSLLRIYKVKYAEMTSEEIKAITPVIYETVADEATSTDESTSTENTNQ